jgi:hypothetical protein
MTDYLLKTIILFVTIFSFSNCFSQENTEIMDLLPVDGYFSNWKIKDSVEIYNGENLFSYINGGADIYLEYGFDKVVSCKYRNLTATEIHLEIYKMTSDTAAFGIFSLSSSGNGISIDQGTKAYLYDYYLDFWKGQYFVRCTFNKKDTLLLDTLQMFAQYTAKKIMVKGTEPWLTNVFKIDNFEFINIKYITGIIGLGNVFNFGHGAIAGFKEGVVGYCKDKMLFAFSYSDDRKCREWFASAKGKMQMNQKFLDIVQKENGFTISDKGGINYCFVPYKRFMIILRGMEWEQAQPVLDQVRKNLN